MNSDASVDFYCWIFFTSADMMTRYTTILTASPPQILTNHESTYEDQSITDIFLACGRPVQTHIPVTVKLGHTSGNSPVLGMLILLLRRLILHPSPLPVISSTTTVGCTEFTQSHSVSQLRNTLIVSNLEQSTPNPTELTEYFDPPRFTRPSLSIRRCTSSG